jgi:hypothetical protein
MQCCKLIVWKRSGGGKSSCDMHVVCVTWHVSRGMCHVLGLRWSAGSQRVAPSHRWLKSCRLGKPAYRLLKPRGRGEDATTHQHGCQQLCNLVADSSAQTGNIQQRCESCTGNSQQPTNEKKGCTGNSQRRCVNLALATANGGV